MTKKLIGTKIDALVNALPSLPSYWGDKYDWNDKAGRYTKKVNGAFIASKYNTIAQIAKETKAEVILNKEDIVITYGSGKCKIQRDLLTDTFLLPLLNSTVGFSKINLS